MIPNQEEASLTEAYLTFVSGTQNWTLQIKVQINSNRCTKVAFERSSLTVDYKIGSPKQVQSLPDLVGTPSGCQATVTQYSSQIEPTSTVLADQVPYVVTLDEPTRSLIIGSNDQSLDGQTAVLRVKA